MRQWDATQPRWKCPLNLLLVPEGWQLTLLAQLTVANGKKRTRCVVTTERKGLGEISGESQSYISTAATGHRHLQNFDSLKQKQVNTCNSQMDSLERILPVLS